MKKLTLKLLLTLTLLLISGCGNVMQLTEGRDFNHKTTMKARNLNIPQNYLKSSKTLLLVRCCYVSVFFFIFCAWAIKSLNH